jgi:PIN domain nuclease of toxin-antitoxin system
MRLLLDTHAFLWFAWDDPKLSRRANDLIEDGANQILVSAASVWEIAIKVGTGKLVLAKPLDHFLDEHFARNEFEVLPVERRHAAHIAALPLHHRDPFDRMLVAQSIVEAMPLVSADPALDAYGITRLW